MEERKWDELNTDCLFEILSRVEMLSLVENVPFVCKSWYKATLDPRCWRALVFPEILYPTNFVKFVVDRSQRSASSICLPSYCSQLDLVYISNGCPLLKNLCLSFEILDEDGFLVRKLIRKWKNLESLKITGCNDIEEILKSVGIYCTNFVFLEISECFIGDYVVSAIFEFIPKIKYLIVKDSDLDEENLVKILEGCRKLELLDTRVCIDLDGDNETLKLASHIKTFNAYGYTDFTDDEDGFLARIGYRDHKFFFHGDNIINF